MAHINPQQTPIDPSGWSFFYPGHERGSARCCCCPTLKALKGHRGTAVQQGPQRMQCMVPLMSLRRGARGLSKRTSDLNSSRCIARWQNVSPIYLISIKLRYSESAVLRRIKKPITPWLWDGARWAAKCGSRKGLDSGLTKPAFSALPSSRNGP